MTSTGTGTKKINLDDTLLSACQDKMVLIMNATGD